MDRITAVLTDATQAIAQGDVDDASLDAYNNLKNILIRKLVADSDGVQAVNMLERTPQLGAASVVQKKCVPECHTDDDREILAAPSNTHYQGASLEWEVSLSGAASGHSCDFANRIVA